MRKLYYKLCNKIGYELILLNSYDTSFNIVKKNTHIALFKYIGETKHERTYKLRMIWSIRIR